MSLATYWFKIPSSIVSQQQKDGVSPVITEFAVRPLTGEDEAIASVGLKDAQQLRHRLLDRSLCGANYDLTSERVETQDGVKIVFKPNPARRVKLEFGGADPNTYPENVRKAMHLRVCMLLQHAFNKLTDGTTEEAEDFWQSQEVVTT